MSDFRSDNTLPIYALHGTTIKIQSDDDAVRVRVAEQWAPFEYAGITNESEEITGEIKVTLTIVEALLSEPTSAPISTGPHVSYYLQGKDLVVSYRNWGRFWVDLEQARIRGELTAASVTAYGVFEDMIIFALAPLLRRRRLFTLHAFAAAIRDRAIILIGDVGTGKTTTGISLLCSGASLISNDSPLLNFENGDKLQVCAYPGLLSAYPDVLRWFPALEKRMSQATLLEGSHKLSFRLDDIWSDRWCQQATPGVLLFPHIEPSLKDSYLVQLQPFEALQRLVSQSIEDWDTSTIPQHLDMFRRLATSAPSYELRLAPDVEKIPKLVEKAIAW